VVISARAAEPVGPYPHARWAGDLLFLSGVGPRQRGATGIPGVALGPDGRITSYDFDTQCRSTFDNVRMILEDAGASLAHVVDVTVFLTNLEADFATMNQVWSERFGDNRPARTTVEVTRLPTPIAIELKVVARIPVA
jgi:2-aminomuconate deaminase